MGTILSTKIKGEGKVVFEILMDCEEAIQLQGHMDNVHVFSENTAELTANVRSRGKNAATKYLLLPKEIRKDINFNKEVRCKKMELKDKVILICMMDRF